MTVAAALTCCCGGEVCFAHYDECEGFGQSLYVRYDNGCPGVHPAVIKNGNGSGQERCWSFVDVHPPAQCSAFHPGCDPNPEIITPSQIIATYQNCTACDDDPPPPDTGACCHGPEGTQCSDVTQLECQELNGTFFPGVDCSQVTCVTPIGACCYIEPGVGGQCANTTAAQCALLGGQWFGPPVTCGTHNCQFGEGGEQPRIVPKGLGDVVAGVTSALGIKPCAGCKKRQDWLNRMVPFSKGQD